MNIRLRAIHACAFVVGAAILAFSSIASADPPSRVARLGYMSGPVSFSAAGDDQWVQASLNRPLTTGDRLWADASARAEIQVGGAMIRMNATTDVSILNLDDQIAQLQLTQGALNVRVRRLEANQAFEVDTPNLAFTVRQPGAYRIEVDPDGGATTIFVRNGQGEVYGEGASYVIDSRQPYRFTGTGLQDYQYVNAPPVDDFDQWASQRDQSYDNSASVRYVSQDVVGYEDLDANGTWRADATYGQVWVPSHVIAGWAPYHDGHWAWVDPWGWTWVDDAPWGFAVSHYGRWASVGGTWCWVPGPVQTRAYYAPALVAFVGGNNFTLSVSSGSVGGVAWFPLGPREVYRPSYTVSRGYFENINRSNTVVNTTVINNYYNNTNVTNVTYVNRQVPGAVVAVPRTTFEQSRPVAKEAVRVDQQTWVNRPVAIAPAVAPTERSVRGQEAEGHKPPPQVIQRTVVAREAPPPARASFAEQKQQLAANPGKPLADEARKELKPEPVAAKPVVKVIAKREEAPPTKAPPPAAAQAPRPGENRPTDEGKKGEERNAPVAPTIANASPRAPAQEATPPQPAQRPAQAARPPQQPDQRAKAEEPGKQAPREQPGVAAPKAPAQPARSPERDRNEPRDRQERAQPAPRAPTVPPQAQVAPPAQPAPRVAAPVQQAPRPAPAAKQPEPPKATPSQARPPQPKPAPSAEPRQQERKPAPRPPEGKKQERDEDKK